MVASSCATSEKEDSEVPFTSSTRAMPQSTEPLALRRLKIFQKPQTWSSLRPRPRSCPASLLLLGQRPSHPYYGRPRSRASVGCGRGRLQARKHGLRLVGPDCLGVLAPRAKLNASYAAHSATPGDLALISQSGTIAAGLVEWAAKRRVGFSGVVSLGEQIDVDVSDCLDYFALDSGTRAILLYIEAVTNARKFMSAARAAARVKLVVVIKAGRHAQRAQAAATHTGALAGSDAVYDAAFRRAGLLRVFDLDETFAAAETLGRQEPFSGKRLAILTNGGGIGVLAVDRLIDLGGVLAKISDET